MCAPRVVAAISDFIVATKVVQENNKNAADLGDVLNRINADAVENSIRDLRAAVYELASFLPTRTGSRP